MSATPVPGFGFLWLLLGVAVLSQAGLYLLYHGLRGRQVGDHPHCRRCRFDLSGTLPQRKDCPECGADVSRADAVQIGLHQRRPGFIIAGAAMLLLATGSLALPLVGRIRQTNWQTYKPIWWLRMDAKAVTGPTADAAWDELLRRQKANLLSRDTEEQLVALVLAWQADREGPWNRLAGDLVEQAGQAGVISREQVEQYYHAAIAPGLVITTRPQVRVGDPCPYRLWYSSPRLGTTKEFCVSSTDGFVTFENGQPIPVRDFAAESQFSARHGMGLRGAFTLDPSMTPGLQQAIWSERFCIYRNWSDVDNKIPPLAELNIRCPFTINVVPADTSTVQLINDPALAAAVRAGVIVKCVEANVEQSGLALVVDFNARPAGLSHRVEMINGNQRIRFSSITTTHSDDTGCRCQIFTDDAERMIGQKVTIVLTPDPDLALSTMDVTNVWNAPLVFEHVEVVKSSW